LRKRISHGYQLRVGIAAHRLRVNLADAAGTEKTKSDCHETLPGNSEQINRIAAIVEFSFHLLFEPSSPLPFHFYEIRPKDKRSK
jgi:hypothetical protein